MLKKTDNVFHNLGKRGFPTYVSLFASLGMLAQGIGLAGNSGGGPGSITKAGVASVAIIAAPASVDVIPGGEVVLSATVTGSANTSVKWTLSSSVGTIGNTGLYTAPASLTQDATITATATAQADVTKTAAVAIRLHANGIYFTTNANGLASVIFNGTNPNFVYSEDLLTVIQTQTPSGTVTQYYDPPCTGAFTTTSVTKNCSAGGDSFTLAVTYSTPALDTVQAQMVFTNQSKTDTIALAGISTLGVQEPFVASTQSSQGVNNTTPVIAVSYGTAQFATWTSTPGPNVGIVETCGWIDICKNATQLTNIAPGQTVTASVLLRFTTNTAENTLSLAPEAYATFAAAWPNVVSWPDRRPIYAWFMSDNSHQSATNPRGYLNNPSMNVSNIPAFTASVLAAAQSIITSIQARPVKPQGIVVWDVEGQEFAQPTSYMGDPRVLGEGYAPEMEAAADQMFALFKNAGLKVGVTLRPDFLKYGPLASRPTTCTSNASPAFDDYYVATDAPYQKTFYACLAPNTWTLDPEGNGWQTMYQSTQVQQVTSLLLAKVAYARARWGTTLYYVDSTVWNGGAAITADVFRALQVAYPDSLFIPEESYLATLAVGMPYATPGGALPSPYAPATWRYAYPSGAQVSNMSNCSGSASCWSEYAANFDIGQKIGDIAMYSVPSQLSPSELTTIESMIVQARTEAGTVVVTDSSTGSTYSFNGSPATINPKYPVKMRVYFAGPASMMMAASTTYCENGSWLGTNSCTLNLAGLTLAQIRYYDFEGNLVLAEPAGPR